MLPLDGTQHTSCMIVYLNRDGRAVYAVIHDDKVTSSDQRHLDLRSEQWDLLSQLVVVLEPLQVATTALSKDQNISSSLIYPVVNGLVKVHLTIGRDDLDTVKKFKEVVTKQLLNRFPFIADGVATTSANSRHNF